MNNLPTKWKVIIALSLLALIITFAFTARRLKTVTTSPSPNPSDGQQSHLSTLLSGSVVAISPSAKEITIRTYRLGNNRTTFASRELIFFTSETSFVRESASKSGVTANVKLNSSDVHLGDLITVVPQAREGSGRIVAAEVRVLKLPSPTK